MTIVANESEVGTELNALASPVMQRKDWFAVYTRANHEKQVAEQLALRDVEQFLPLYKEKRQWSDRKVCIEVPLFPGYLFVRMALELRLRVLGVPGVARLIGFNGQPYALPEREIATLRAGIANALHIEPHPYLSEGCRVRIARGPLCGAEGLLVRRKNGCRVVLSLDLIAMSAAVEVDEADVKPIA